MPVRRPQSLALHGRIFEATTWPAAFGLFLLLAPAFIGSTGWAVDGVVSEVTAPSLISLTAGGDSFGGEFTADGLGFVFVSRAGNLVPGDQNEAADVFYRDLRFRTNRLVSVAQGGDKPGNGDSGYPSIAGDGRWVAFASRAADLVPNDVNGLSDVFVRDLKDGVTRLVSVDAAGAQSGRGGSSFPAVASGGRWVGFESYATNLVTGGKDLNLAADVFVRELSTETTRLISHVWSDAAIAAGGASRSPALTPDGSLVAFVSTASNLVRNFNPAQSAGEVYIADLAAGTNIWASQGATNYRSLLTVSPSSRLCSYNPALSQDGLYVAFKTALVPQGRALILRRNLKTGQTDLVSSNSVGVSSGITDLSGPVMSADGRLIAYEGRTNGSPFSVGSLPAVYVWDAQTGVEQVISVAADATTLASAAADTPALSADGRFAAFLSYATNLVDRPVSGLCQLYWRDLNRGETRLASAGMDGFSTGDGDAAWPVLSPDGLKVAFQSAADDLFPMDYNEAYDVYLRDVVSDYTEVVSQGHAAVRVVTAGAGSVAAGQCLSAGAAQVVFVSSAPNLVAGDTNHASDVFVRDLPSGGYRLVSVNGEGYGSASGSSWSPALSGDGRYVAFTSMASNLVAATSGFADTNTAEDIYLQDLQTGTTWPVSTVPDGLRTGNKASSRPSLSADGRWVAYQTLAANLGRSDSNGKPDVYVYDRDKATNYLISANWWTGNAASDASEPPVISADGRWVVFQSRASDLVEGGLGFGYRFYARDLHAGKTHVVSGSLLPSSNNALKPSAVISADSRWVVFPWSRADLYLHDLVAATNLLLCGNCSSPSISADGRYVAYRGLGAKGYFDIYERDNQAGTTRLMSVNLDGTGGGNGASSAPWVSADGRFVVFQTRATDLVSGDNNRATDVVVRDAVANATFLLSLNRSGTAAGNRLSTVGALDPEGHTVVFSSFATDLAAGDYNGAQDVFLVRLQSGDSDKDSLPDQWELTYFGDLRQDGSADADRDGASDRDEYQAGTNPTNDVSVFEVLTVTAVPAGTTTIIWRSAVNQSYRVQYKNNLSQMDWQTLPGLVTATGPQSSVIDSTAAENPDRFYRVILAP